MESIAKLKKLAKSIDLDVVRGGRRKSIRHLKIVMIGAGVIGASVGAWVSKNYDNIWFYDLPDVAKELKAKGVSTYPEHQAEQAESVPLRVLDDLSQAKDADVVIIGVKNYSLEAVSKQVLDTIGDKPLIVGMQNGIVNRRILPEFFSKVIYCVVSYNAWKDDDGAIAYQQRGPLHIGTMKNELMAEMQQLADILNLGVTTHVTERLDDAVHSKLILNLTNSLTTLIGFGIKPIDNEKLLQKLLTNLLSEGVDIVKAAGYKESRLGGMPPWIKIQAGAKLPRFITKGLFRRNVKKMVISSMAQDVILHGRKDTELDTINGYFLELADKHKIKAPYNRAIYELCVQEFAKDDFQPLDIEMVWAAVKKLI